MRSTTITMATLACLGLAIPANAETKYFDVPNGSTGDWSDDANWHLFSCIGNGTFKPGPNDAVIICAGEDSTLDADFEIQTVSVKKDGSDVGIVRIPTGRVLKLNADEGTSVIDGRILLSGKLELDWADPVQASHVFGGDGDIEGLGGFAEIFVEGQGISSAPTLVVRNTIHGVLDIVHTIGEDAGLNLDGGTIHADGDGLLLVQLSAMEDGEGGGTPLLKVSTFAGATLYLDLVCNGTPIACGTHCLEFTEVEIFKGTFKFAQTFKTNGRLTMQTGGKMDVPDNVEGWFETTVCGP